MYLNLKLNKRLINTYKNRSRICALLIYSHFSINSFKGKAQYVTKHGN